MTERKRPWWMLHWPSWLALVAITTSFAVMNVTARLDPKLDLDRDLADLLSADERPYVAGWPATWASVKYRPLDVISPTEWIWSRPPSLLRDPPDISEPEGGVLTIMTTQPIKRISPTISTRPVLLVTNLLVGLVVVVGAVSLVERGCSSVKVRFTLRSMLALFGVAAAITMVTVHNPLGREGLRTGLFGAALVIACIAIGLASLAVLDGIGWLFGRLPKKAKE